MRQGRGIRFVGTVFALCSIAFLSFAHATYAEEVTFPSISIENIQNSLPNPILDFVSGTKHLGNTIPQTLNMPEVKIDIPATKEWFASPEHFWNKLEQWIYAHTGVSLNAIFGLFVTAIQTVIAAIVWVVNFIFGTIRYVLSFFE